MLVPDQKIKGPVEDEVARQHVLEVGDHILTIFARSSDIPGAGLGTWIIVNPKDGDLQGEPFTMEYFPGCTAMIPPPTPLLPGRPTL